MPENFTEDKFVARVEELGMAAFAAKGTDDFPMCYRKLLEYFKTNYIYYLLIKYKLPPDFIERKLLSGSGCISAKEQEKYETVENCYYYAMGQKKENDEGKVEDTRIENKLLGIVNNFSAEKASNNSNPFFSYMISYYHLPGIKYAEEQKAADNRVHGMNPFKSRKDLEALKRILDYEKCFPTFNVTSNYIKTVAEKLGMDPKYAEKIIIDNDISYGAQKTDISEILSFLDTDEHNKFSDDENLSVFDKHSDDTEKSFAEFLKQLNDIYDESFLEIHQFIFPDCFTGDYLKNVVTVVMEKNSKVNTLEATVKEFWNDLLIEDRRKMYASGKYVCISAFIFAWFEQERRIITQKMIAEEKNMSTVRVSRKYKEALEIAQNAMKKLKTSENQ